MAIGIVTTKYGKISGFEARKGKYSGITYFNGVPYAAPPVGELRWKPPADPASWKGVRECTKNAPRSPQVGNFEIIEPYASDFFYMGQPDASEDCLYLNITTGAQSVDEKRPVFMWFHGGGLENGYTYEVEFEPSELARKGVVIVMVAQRLNILGYLALPQLSAEQGGKSGNYGFMDEVKALDWVYDNIAAFGGDPENITIGGQSGGTWKTGALASSPAQKGRVKRVINQSYLCWLNRYQTLEEAEKTAIKYLESIGIDSKMSMEDLCKLPCEAFYPKNSDSDVSIWTYEPHIPSSVVCDGELVPEIDISVSIEKYASDCDYLSGINYGECSITGAIFAGIEFSCAEDVYHAAKKLLGDLYTKYDFENLVKITDEDADHVARRLAAEGLTPQMGIMGIMIDRYFGMLRAKKHPNSNSYCYLFSHVTPSRPEEKGTMRDPDVQLAWHSSELWYTFASLREGVPPCRSWTEKDFILADQISTYWANFIKTGNPNGDGLPEWPASSKDYGWMELGDTLLGYTGLQSGIDAMIYEYITTRFNLPE